MALVHLAAVHGASGQVTLNASAWIYPVIAGCLVLLHGTRRLLVRDELAERWLLTRGFATEPRGVSDIKAYLARLRTARFIGSLVFLVLGVMSSALFSIPIGVVSGPYLLSVLGAELLTPQPRQGRERKASLQAREAGFYAPRRAVMAVRILFAAGLIVAGIAALAFDTTEGLVHMALLVVGAGAYETCLRTISSRGLPTASVDLARDTAVRVASSRTTTAAGVSFAAFGAMYSLVLAVHNTAPGWWGRPIANQVLTLTLPAVIAAVIWLLQPVRSWHPDTA